MNRFRIVVWNKTIIFAKSKNMTVFKYRSLSDLKRVLDIIVNKRLFGAKYLTLNDPMEGQFEIDSSKNLPHTAIQQLFDDRANTLICSLSDKRNCDGRPNNGIMWSMYADEHKGCCIEVEVDDPNWQRIKVYYSKLPPIVDNPYIQVMDILSIKYYQWQYEDEIRYISTNPKTPYLNVKVKAVYFGIRVSKEDFAFYKSLIQSIDSSIKVEQMKRKEISWVR